MRPRAFLVLAVVVVASTAVGTSGTAAAAGPTSASSSSSWSKDALSWPTVRRADLSSTDCTDGTCLAVGSTVSSGGASVPFAEQEGSAGAWTRQTVPLPAHADDAVLTDVSCGSRHYCMAVGHQVRHGVRSPLIERWHGTNWTPVASPALDGQGELNAVSCVASTCEAVGDVTTDAGTATLVEQSGAGGAWTVASVPSSGAAYNTFFDVSCTSSGFCAAVGTAGGEPPDLVGSYEALLFTAGGGTSPNLHIQQAGDIATLHGVSCPSQSFCLAVGWQTGFPDENRPLVQSWNGSKWSSRTASLPSGSVGDVELRGVSCRSGSSCVAVGAETSYDAQPFAWTWTGTSLDLTAAPNSQDLAAITCRSTCVAAGGNGPSSIESFDGTMWTDLAGIRPPAPTDNELLADSCVSSSWCMAVGDKQAATGSTAGLSELWDGTSWTPVAVPTTQISVEILDTVSCTSTSFCVAGGHTSGSSGYASVVLMWNGSTWSAADVPNAGGVQGVSCVSASACVAGASFQDSLIWNGRRWKQVPLADPDDSPQVYDLDCLTADNCYTVGTIGGDWPNFSPAMIEHWDGTQWTRVSAPSGPKRDYDFLTGISCASATSCVAVGTSGEGVSGPDLLFTYDGTSWTSLRRPANDRGLSDVSCVSTTECVAVGPARDVFTLSGPTWTISRSAQVNGATSGPDLRGVDCVDGTCRAVGSYQRGGLQLGVAESEPVG